MNVVLLLMCWFFFTLLINSLQLLLDRKKKSDSMLKFLIVDKLSYYFSDMSQVFQTPQCQLATNLLLMFYYTHFPCLNLIHLLRAFKTIFYSVCSFIPAAIISHTVNLAWGHNLSVLVQFPQNRLLPSVDKIL